MSSSAVDWESILRLAITLACDAGAELRRRFGRQVVVTLKDELDPVTDADQAVETLIRQGIQAHFPTHDLIQSNSTCATASPRLIQVRSVSKWV